ncbi:MAG: hypothetical protein ACOY93_00525 [Bacillota bacterium]
MRPYLVGGACHRLQERLDAALSSGQLELPAELAAHAERCPQCGPQVRQTEALFRRLRAVPASLDLGPVPGVVDSVLRQVTAEPPAPAASSLPESARQKRRSHLRWVLGQIAVVAVVLCIAVSGVTYLALKVNQAVGGARPSEVVARWVAPLQNWSEALFRSMK